MIDGDHNSFRSPPPRPLSGLHVMCVYGTAALITCASASRTPNGLLTCIQKYLLSQKESKHPSESTFSTGVSVDSNVQLFMYEYYIKVKGENSVTWGEGWEEVNVLVGVVYKR